VTAPLRGVLFDAAGTLMELRETVGETYARVAARHGVRLPAWRLDDAFTRVLRAAPARVFPGASLAEAARRERAAWREIVRATFRAADQGARFEPQPDRDAFDACFDALWDHYAEPAAWRAREGAGAALDALADRGLALGVVSNFDQRLPAVLAGLGLAARLQAIVLPAHAAAAKPDRRIFAHALAALGLAAPAALYVGDDAEHDLAGALAAGLCALDVNRLVSLRELPDRIAEAALPSGT
jgi:putative hydrolase of the HAD superfamily